MRDRQGSRINAPGLACRSGPVGQRIVRGPTTVDAPGAGCNAALDSVGAGAVRVALRLDLVLGVGTCLGGV